MLRESLGARNKQKVPVPEFSNQYSVSLPTIKGIYRRKTDLPKKQKYKWVQPTASTLGLSNQTAFISNVAGAAGIPKDKRVYKQTFTMGIPKDTVSRLPSQYLRKGKGIEELSKKMEEARTIRAISAKYDKTQRLLSEKRAEKKENEENANRQSLVRNESLPLSQEENIFNAIAEDDEESYSKPFVNKPRQKGNSSSQMYAENGKDPRQRPSSDVSGLNNLRQDGSRSNERQKGILSGAVSSNNNEDRSRSMKKDRSFDEGSTLPPLVSNRDRSQGNPSAKTNKSRKKTAKNSTNFEKWYDKNKKTASGKLDPDELQDVITALKVRWNDLNVEFQKSSHKRYLSAAQAQRQQAMDQQMKQIEGFLLRMNYDLGYFLTS